MATLKKFVKQLLQDSFLWDNAQVIRQQHHLRCWRRAGRPLPPPHIVKQQVVIATAIVTGNPIFVETGTYDGDMTYAVRDYFEHAYTIEVFQPLYQRAAKRFSADSRVEVIHGDSALKLPELLERIQGACVFWLDGHFSGTLEGLQTGKAREVTPIFDELRSIAAHPCNTHAILIDDARCFTGAKGYPALRTLEEEVERLFPEHSLLLRDDIIRILR